MAWCFFFLAEHRSLVVEVVVVFCDAVFVAVAELEAVAVVEAVAACLRESTTCFVRNAISA